MSGLHTSINAHIVQGIQEAPESRPPKMSNSVDYVNAPVLDPEEEYNFDTAGCARPAAEPARGGTLFGELLG